MNDVLLWLESSGLSQLMRDVGWLFPAAEILHFIGLSLLMGTLLVVDCRLVGLIRNVSPAAVYRLLPLSFVGFSINVLTGTLFCFADPFRYYPNPAFRLKMLLVLLAGINALYFKISVHPNTVALSEQDDAGIAAKVVAVLSLLIWIAVIVFGRLIPYVE